MGSVGLGYPVGSVIEVGGHRMPTSIREMFQRQVINRDGVTQKRLLPTACCYDDDGLKLWSKIVASPAYYQLHDEIQMLKDNGPQICEYIEDGVNILDLGAGDVRKVKPLLDHLESRQKRVRYFAVDISRDSLEGHLATLSSFEYQYVQCYGAWATFDDAAIWSQTLDGPKLFCSFGSIFGNDSFDDAVVRLRQFSKLMSSEDLMLLGIDACADKDLVHECYNDEDGIYHEFVLHGAQVSNKVMGHSWYQPGDWELLSRVENEPLEHRYIFKAKRDVTCEPLNLHFKEGDEILCFEAYKNHHPVMSKQFAASGLQEMKFWESASSRIDQYLLKAT